MLSAGTMLSLAIAAALSATAPAPGEPVRPDRQARATVRIVRAATVKIGEEGGTEAEGAVRRETTLPARDGSAQLSTLIEFY